MRTPWGWPASTTMYSGVRRACASCRLRARVPVSSSGAEGSCIEWMSSSQSARATKGRNAASFAGVGCGDALVEPLAVQVFVDVARRVVPGGIETVEGFEVAQGQCEPALLRTQTGLQQTLDGPGATQFVAVHQGADHQVAPGLARVEVPYAFGAGVACAPSRQVRHRQCESRGRSGRRGRGVSSSILAEGMILRDLATSAARNWSMSSLVAATVAPLSCIFWRNSLDCKLSCSAFLSLSSVGRGRPAGAIRANQPPISTFLYCGDSASAGMSGVMAERLASVVPSAISLPLLMYGRPLESANMPNSRLLPNRPLASGAKPRYGICVTNNRPCSLIISPAKCSEVPTPELP